MTGSMLIPNDTGNKTLLILDHARATANPSENALQFARAALKRELSSPSPKSGNIKFLREWILFASVVPNSDPPPIPSTSPIHKLPSLITSPEKTSVRLLNEPFEKDNFLEAKGEQESI